MKTRLLIIIGIIITGVIIALTIGTMEYQSTYNQNCNSDGGKMVGFLRCVYINEDYDLSYDENAQYFVEQLFMGVLEEIYDDTLQVKTLVVIKSKNNESLYDNYCGFAQLENQEVWFDADFAENQLIQGSIVNPPSPYCEDDDHSCFCDLQEKVTGERKSYEEFFREHVSEICPVIPMSEDDHGLSFDPTKCEWIENEKSELQHVPAESERKILQCYGIFNCNVSSQYFESCIGAKKNGVTIEQLCLDSDITIDNGCATIVFPDSTKTVSCHYEIRK